IIAPLIGTDGSLVDEQLRLRRADLALNPHVHSGNNLPAWGGKDRTPHRGARSRVERQVAVIEYALVRISFFVGQGQSKLRRILFGVWKLVLTKHFHVAQKVVLADVELRVNRVKGLNVGERSRLRL